MRQSPSATEFDPVHEGTRYRLVAAISLAVWDGVCRESTHDDGQRDEQEARRRFHQVAARIGAGRGA
ncbi:MAG TPA: hypothetical protein VHW23_10630 [Kofleriaceae bacterium]|nr:hypothetical protein [Kofleriaceae bacterium]